MEAGIDEAGRGPVLGPLVVAGVATADPQRLADLGCKDSKKLSPAKRVRLARLLEDDSQVQIAVRIIEPADLDAEMATATLNEVVLRRFQSIAEDLDAPRTVVDAADVDAARFGRRVAEALPEGAVVVAEHKADDRHATVAAASIIAKVARDNALDDLARRLERRIDRELGSGYPSDGKTVAFLEAWLDRFGDLPEGTRRAWKTSKRLLADRAVQPTRLDDFGANA